MEDKNEIGAMAKLLDSEKTVTKRMKLERKTLKKLGMALVFYSVAMVLIGLFL